MLSKTTMLRVLACLMAVGLGAGFAPGAQAQDFPSKPLRIVVPFPAGGTTDVVARLVAQRMSESLGQQVLVDNRGGAGGTIGADIVAKSAPDGHTLLMHNITFPLSSVAQARRSSPRWFTMCSCSSERRPMTLIDRHPQ